MRQRVNGKVWSSRSKHRNCVGAWNFGCELVLGRGGGECDPAEICPLEDEIKRSGQRRSLRRQKRRSTNARERGIDGPISKTKRLRREH